MHEGYDVAQVCPNGHVANSSIVNCPEFNQDFCAECGEKTVTTCENCKVPIRGLLWGGSLGIQRYKPPAYCINCGSALPWTDRKIEAAIELSLDGGELQGEDVEQLKQSVQQIVRDTPQTQLAASRFKKLMLKVGVGTRDAVREILIEIASETAKRIIWPDAAPTRRR